MLFDAGGHDCCHFWRDRRSECYPAPSARTVESQVCTASVHLLRVDPTTPHFCNDDSIKQFGSNGICRIDAEFLRQDRSEKSKQPQRYFFCNPCFIPLAIDEAGSANRKRSERDALNVSLNLSFGPVVEAHGIWRCTHGSHNRTRLYPGCMSSFSKCER